MVALKKTLLFVHRWLGVALCIVFLLWFPSGIGMMYWTYPAVTAGDRLERSHAIDPSKVVLSPTEAAEKSGTPITNQIRLNTFDGRPVYRLGPSTSLGTGGGRGGATIVYADTGEQQVATDEAMLDRIASKWTGQAAEAATVAPLEEVDQWTIQTFRTASPLVKYSWPDGEQLYISEFTGEVIQHTTTGSRLAAHVSAIPHWLYYTPLRKNGATWTRVVIWSSAIGTFAAILGIVVAIWMYSPSKKYRFAGGPSAIPYQGQKRWHMILGLIFGIATATWAFSGMLSMDPFPQPTRRVAAPGAGGRSVGPSIQQALRGRIEMDAFAAAHPRTALEQLQGLDVREVEWTSFAGQPVYLATLRGGDTRVVPLDGQARETFTTDEIMNVVRQAAGDDGLRELRVLEQYDRYYLDRTRQRPLPVVLATTNEDDSTRFYIDPNTGRVAGTYSSRNWVNRWAYHALHSLDFPWLYNYRPAWDIVVIAFMLGGTALCVTSLVLAWRVIGKKLTRIVPMKPSTATFLLALVLAAPACAQAAAQAAPAAPVQAPPPVPPPPGWQATPDANRTQAGPFKQHSITLTVAPKEGMEFKYRLATGAAMLYAWTSSAPLFFEMHASPDEAPRFAEFWEKSEAGARSTGSYVAPFTGIHGWFWENRTGEPITITLTASGFFTETIEFRSGQRPMVTPLP